MKKLDEEGFAVSFVIYTTWIAMIGLGFYIGMNSPQFSTMFPIFTFAEIFGMIFVAYIVNLKEVKAVK